MNTPLPKTLFAFSWHFLKKQWKLLVIIQLLSFAWSIDHTMWPYIIMVLIDSITNFTGDRVEMWSVLSTPIIMGIILWISVELSFRVSGILLARLIPKLEADVRLSMFDYVQAHSHLYFSNNMAGAIANKISDMPQSLTRILLQVVQLFLPVAMALIISTVLFARINPLFAILLVAWMIIHMSICFYYARYCDHYANVHAEARSKLAGKVVDSLTNTTNIKLFSRHRFEYWYLSLFQKEEQQKHWESLWYIEKMKFALGIASFLGAGIALNWYMLYSWQQEQITTGEVVFIFNTSWNITIMAWLAGLELPQLFKEIGICRQALSIIQDPHDIVDAPAAKSLRLTKGEIVFDNVTFRYGKSANLFQNKNITIEAGQKVGLVGFSGSGKTSFVNLILRYFDIDSGRILIDGQDIAKVTQDSLRSQIAVIPQDPSLFHRSLMENIRYGYLEATDEEVIEASKKAHCHEFVLKMPEKYDSLVGERGIKLSGGQRQRIAIARAILKNAPILILDEATSALDSVTEREIQEGLDILMQNHTTIVVAHRLSTLSGMDRILVFKEGKIAEDGTHDELIAENGHYARMWDMQAGGFLPEEE
ncbi:MAG: ABC transporter ATP-binding protein [Parachlamydiaceae bacterium]|nr:ABC transporter ATP-binding protein [Parachlamydiaceae bacterium]